ncbi:hypothetical protein V501_03672 [Pseudogymnoascus sp. VKM F-4519 (FW-2642)]|nr:hypothetical protein V501_03672 [Pseudogymnoascus sp. VKM F-4519 (FW-2642)]
MKFNILLMSTTLLTGLSVAESKVYSMRLRDLAYPEVKPVIVGTINGVELEVEGTIEEFYAKAQEVEPTIADELFAPRDTTPRLESRTITGRLCYPIAGQPWQPARLSALHDGANYLAAKGDVRIRQAGKSCGRISCSYSGGIFICNDNTWEVSPMARFLAETVYASNQICRTNKDYSCSQAFDSSGFNLITRAADC